MSRKKTKKVFEKPMSKAKDDWYENPKGIQHPKEPFLTRLKSIFLAITLVLSYFGGIMAFLIFGCKLIKWIF